MAALIARAPSFLGAPKEADKWSSKSTRGPGDCDRRAPGVQSRAHHVVQRGLSLSPPSRHVRGLDVLPNLPASRPNRAPDRVATGRIWTMAKDIQCHVLSRICRPERSCGDIGAAFSVTPQCGIEAFDEGMTVDRLAKEGDGAGRLCALANSLFGEGGNEDDGHIRTAYGQLALQFQPTHSLHLHVRDQARGVMQSRRG